jgi:hypothetical protein
LTRSVMLAVIPVSFICRHWIQRAFNVDLGIASS